MPASTVRRQTEPKGTTLAFLSYSHSDDQYLGGFISRFRTRLTEAIRFHEGNDQLELFQDSAHIEFGEQWRKRIHTELENVPLLIAMLTPRYFKSKECREELALFMERERRLGREDLVLPVYLADYAALESEEARVEDELAAALAGRERVDWRKTRQLSARSRHLKEEFEKLALMVLTAVDRAHGKAPRTPQSRAKAAAPPRRPTPLVVPAPSPPAATTAAAPASAPLDDVAGEEIEIGSAVGQVVPGEGNVYTLVLQAGLSYHVYAQPEGPFADLDLEVFDENGNLVGEDATANTDAYCLVKPTLSGTFQIVVYCVQGTGYYRLVVAPDGPDATEALSGRRPVVVRDVAEDTVHGTIATGALMAGEEQHFDVVLTAGHPHVVYVEPDDPSADFDLLVYDENLNLVHQDTTSNSDAYCEVTPVWTGQFRLVVQAISGVSRFQLFVQD